MNRDPTRVTEVRSEADSGPKTPNIRENYSVLPEQFSSSLESKLRIKNKKKMLVTKRQSTLQPSKKSFKCFNVARSILERESERERNSFYSAKMQPTIS